MYKLDQDNPYLMTAVDPKTGKKLVLDASGEGLLENIEKMINSQIKGNGIVAKTLRGTLHITCYILESDMRRRRYLRGEPNPVERRFKL